MAKDVVIVSRQFLAGNFAPVKQDQTFSELTVTWPIPGASDGRHPRNRANPISKQLSSRTRLHS